MTSSSLSGLKPPATNKMDKEVQVSILLHCIDEACVEVYNTLGLTDEEKKKYDTIIKKIWGVLCTHQEWKKNLHIFFTRG